MSPAGKILFREHTLLAVIWFVAWIVFVAVLVAQNDRHTWHEKALRACFAWMIILPHGATLIMLAEKWQSAARRTWLMIAGLSFVGAIMFFYILAGL